MEREEAVARAICASMGYEPGDLDDELLDTIPSNESHDGWQNWLSFRREAKAAIKAYEAWNGTVTS